VSAWCRGAMWLRLNAMQTADMTPEAIRDGLSDVTPNVRIADRLRDRDLTSVVCVAPTVGRANLCWSEDKGLLDRAHRLGAEAMRTRRQSRVTDRVESAASCLKVIAVQAVSLVYIPADHFFRKARCEPFPVCPFGHDGPEGGPSKSNASSTIGTLCPAIDEEGCFTAT
jgi:hypothetical protein